MLGLALPTVCILFVAAAFLTLERIAPGRELPHAPGWYGRAVLVNLIQAAIILRHKPAVGRSNVRRLAVSSGGVAEPGAAGLRRLVRRHILLLLVAPRPPPAGFWVVFHQVHHSPARIEAMTAFYKQPIEILADGALAAGILYLLLGCTLEGALWFNFFAAAGELFYHSNIRTPRWVKYVIQTPELHSIHHELDVHHFNYADLPLWDRLFGTYRDADTFATRCGFPRHNERQLGRMLLFPRCV